MEASARRFGPDEDSSNGLLLGVLAGTMVRTLDGILPVEFLEPGDRVITRSGAMRLGSISVCKRRAMRVIRIRASTQGHDRPENDLIVAPGQSVVIRDWRARTLYGAAIATIPADRLADGEFVVPEVLKDVRIFSLRFAEDEVIWAEGLELACPAMETETAQL